MTDLKQAAQQALEVLEGLADYRYTERVKNTMASLRVALAEPEQEPIALNNGRLTQYPDGSIGVGTPAEPVQEPVAWLDPDSGEVCRASWLNSHAPDHHVDRFTCPLYTAHTPRKPLTDGEIVDIYKKWDVTPGVSMADFARAIERAHGIGEQHE